MEPNQPDQQNNNQTPPDRTGKMFNMGAVAVTNSDSPELEPGEKLVTVVKRHSIGIVGIYLEMFTGIAGVVTLVLLSIFVFFSQVSTSTKGLIAGLGVFVIAFLVGLLLIASFVYKRSRLIVTDVSLVQVIQNALFNRKVSRLSMSNVEDVTVEQRGILPSMFGYGTITIQTAGQEDNFIFPFCPDPNKIAHSILEVRQLYVEHHGDSGSKLMSQEEISSIEKS